MDGWMDGWTVKKWISHEKPNSVNTSKMLVGRGSFPFEMVPFKVKVVNF